MKEILFRGQKPDNKEWVYGSLLESDDGKKVIVVKNKNFISKQDNRGWYVNAPCYEVIPESVGEFTNLSDKYNIKIFDGDIINWVSNNPFSLGEKRVCKVIWGGSGLWWCYGLSYPKICIGLGELISNEKIEVIGSIYDNPELIKCNFKELK